LKPSSFRDDDAPRRSHARSNAFGSFGDMKENLPPRYYGKGSLYEEDMRERREGERTVPGYGIPEYVPSSYDVRPGDRAPPSARSSSYRSDERGYERTPLGARSISYYEAENGSRPSTRYHPSAERTHGRPGYIPSSYDTRPSGYSYCESPRGESYGYAHSHSTHARPQPSSYGSSSSSHSRGPYYEELQPSSGYSSGSSDSGYFSDSFNSSRSDYSSHSSYSSSSNSIPPIQPQGIKPPTDLYTVLNIPRSATASEIKKAHRVMSLRWHPDRCQGADKKKATDRMAEINMANDVLGDEEKRKWYDRWGTLPSHLC
jgi:hypothetical protein